MRPLIVTGADARYFAMSCLLTQSVARWLPGARVMVCDFGLSAAQRRFLEADGRLLPRPPSAPEGIHPHLAKAALADYLAPGRPGAPMDDGPTLWLDCDMMVMAPLADRLAAALEAMARAGVTVAACADAEVPDIAAFIARWGVRPFAEAVTAAGIDPRLPYFNSGLFLCAGRGVLTAVRDRCAALEDHRMIDQNGFNLAARSPDQRCALLEAAVWNVHGRLLADVGCSPDGEARRGAQRAVILHATSVGGAHHEERAGVLRGDVGDFPIVVKFFRDPSLARTQRQLLGDFVTAHRAALADAGCYR